MSHNVRAVCRVAKFSQWCVPLVGLWLGVVLGQAGERMRISGIYPHLAMFNNEAECGTGGVVPWAGRLWVVTYAPHKPTGSSDKLYEITPQLEQFIRPESIGGTPANRMIHRESQQLFLGPYAIGADRVVRVIPYERMFGRPTGNARHLTDPAHKIYYATMEEGIYEVDVHSLAVRELWGDEHLNPRSLWQGVPKREGRFADFPGYHGKGFYSGQGVLVYANNGEHGADALRNPEVPSGVLAEWDGRAQTWTTVRRSQFTDVTGPGGIYGNQRPAKDPIWSIGWDHRSLILMVRDAGQWHAFRLPKPSHAYDGAHGWNTEWPRIRDIGSQALLMTMHGGFWRFPKTFSAVNSAGVVPRSTYLKVIGDFCRWQDEVVFGCDDTAQSEFLNKDPLKGSLAGPGRSQSNLWFVEPPRLDSFGPPLGRGSVWLDDPVEAGVPSEPFLLSGFAKRSLHLAHHTDEAVTFRLEIDPRGRGRWEKLRDVIVPAKGSSWIPFSERPSGVWLRLTTDRDADRVTAFFHYRAEDRRGITAAAIFDGIARPNASDVSGGILFARGGDFKTLRWVARNAAGDIGGYDLDADLKLRRVDDPEGVAWVKKHLAMAKPMITMDAASVLHVDSLGRRWRLPRGDSVLDEPGVLGDARLCREVVTERNLLNVHGTFYELPAENAGGFIKLRPIATHNRRIHDFASYRGLLVMSGVENSARGERIVRSDDGRCALWVGSVDDLWTFGKPRGQGGPWLRTPVQANTPSDPYLATGYDRKRVTLSHDGPKTVRFRIEADFTGTGVWHDFASLPVHPGRTLTYEFPDGFGAYWLRVTASTDCTATAQWVYD